MQTQILSWGPNGGNPTPMGQGHRPGAPGLADLTAQQPARGCLVEAVGVLPYRMKVKRREASVAGKSACSDKARYPLVPQAYGRRDGSELSWSYPVRSAGPRESGKP